MMIATTIDPMFLVEPEEPEVPEGSRWSIDRIRNFYRLDEPLPRGDPVGDCHFCNGSVAGVSYFHAYNEQHQGWEHLSCWRRWNRKREAAKNAAVPSGNGEARA